MWNVLQNEDEHCLLGNSDTKYCVLIIHIWLQNNRQKRDNDNWARPSVVYEHFWSNIVGTQVRQWWSVLTTPLSFDAPRRGTPAIIRTKLPQTLYLYKLESFTYILPLIVWTCLRSNFSCGLREFFLFLQEWRFGRSGSSKVIDFGTNRKGVCDFLLVRHGNLGPILHCFEYIAGFGSPDCTRIPPQIADVRGVSGVNSVSRNPIFSNGPTKNWPPTLHQIFRVCSD